MTEAYLTTDGIITGDAYHTDNDEISITEMDRQRVLQAITNYSRDISRGIRGNVTALDPNGRSHVYDKFMVDIPSEKEIPDTYIVMLSREERKYVTTALLATAHDARATSVNRFLQMNGEDAEETAEKFSVEPRTPGRLVYRRVERKHGV